MANGSEIKQLRNQLAQYERNSRRTSWLLRQLRWKIKNAPSEFYERMQRSIEKRRKRSSYETSVHQKPSQETVRRSVKANISSNSKLASSAASDYKEAGPFYMSETM